MAGTIPVVAIALAGLPVRVAAQDAALPSVPQTISLEEAVEIAQRYNPLFPTGRKRPSGCRLGRQKRLRRVPTLAHR